MLNRDAPNSLQVFPETQFHSFCPSTIQNLDRQPQENVSYPLAYAHAPGKSPGIIFLPGFMSTMKSTKPRAIYQYCQQHQLEFTTLDYSGHPGETDSTNKNHTISQWMEEALCILQHVTVQGEQILVGSSMGAWIAILLAQYKSQQEGNEACSSKAISGILGIASAPDFTSIWMEQIESNDELVKQMTELEYCDMPSEYDESGFYRIQQDFLQDATKHYVLDQPLLNLDIPVTLIHGLKDKDIPYSFSEDLFSKLDNKAKKKNELILVEDGDHRLSKPHELEKILLALDKLRNKVTQSK